MAAEPNYIPYLTDWPEAFISHSGEDSKKSVALPIKNRLEKGYKIRVFVDETDLPVAGNAYQNMEEALKSCQVLAQAPWPCEGQLTCMYRLPQAPACRHCHMTFVVNGNPVSKAADLWSTLQLAIVIFSPKFWTSTSCIKELTQVVEFGVMQQRFLYLPIFMYINLDAVKVAARDHLDGRYVAQVSTYLSYMQGAVWIIRHPPHCGLSV